MLYMLCEDTQSWYTFLSKSFVSAFIPDCSIICPSGNRDKDGNLESCGYREVLKQLINLSDKLVSGDSLIIFMDIAADNKAIYDTLIQIKSKLSQLNKLGVQCYLSEYYCSEEVFLSFEKLPTFINMMSNVLEELKRVQYYIKHQFNMLDYIESDTTLLHLFNKFNRPKNREHFASDLLNYFTSKGLGNFRIAQKTMSSCWYCNCCEEFKEEQAPKYEKCPLYFAKPTSKDKFLDLYYNSILKDSIPEFLISPIESESEQIGPQPNSTLIESVSWDS